jgi:hypothetical protein
MSDGDARELMELTRRLLEAIATRDWGAYQELCDPAMTCFEPETRGSLVEGLDFHQFYFSHGGHMGDHADTIFEPRVRMLGPDAAIVCYVRLVQRLSASENPATLRFAETRVWERRRKGWRHVHSHRSSE